MRTNTSGICLGLMLVVVPADARGQEVPPRPIPDMVADFMTDPMDTDDLVAALATCPLASDSWQREMVGEVAALPPNREQDESLAILFSAAQDRCRNELIASWLRGFLERDQDSPFLIGKVAAALGRSPVPEDRGTAIRAIFDARYSEAIRSGIMSEWVRASETPRSEGIELIAEAYEQTTAGQPPTVFLGLAVGTARALEGDVEGLNALRALLQAVDRNPDHRAAIPILNVLLSATGPLPPDDPWFQELGQVVEALAERPGVPDELQDFLGERLERVCRGSNAERNPKCDTGLP